MRGLAFSNKAAFLKGQQAIEIDFLRKKSKQLGL